MKPFVGTPLPSVPANEFNALNSTRPRPGNISISAGFPSD